jgi:hypothetical protein
MQQILQFLHPQTAASLHDTNSERPVGMSPLGGLDATSIQRILNAQALGQEVF